MIGSAPPRRDRRPFALTGLSLSCRGGQPLPIAGEASSSALNREHTTDCQNERGHRDHLDDRHHVEAAHDIQPSSPAGPISLPRRLWPEPPDLLAVAGLSLSATVRCHRPLAINY